MNADMVSPKVIESGSSVNINANPMGNTGFKSVQNNTIRTGTRKMNTGNTENKNVILVIFYLA